MKIQRLGSRGIVFSFPELDQVNLVAIYGKQYTYLCDTFIGPDPMEKIKSFFVEEKRNQPILIFNSHWDWDHVWGNCAFPDSIVLSHKACRDNLEGGFWSELERNKTYIQGDVKPHFPNVVFTDEIEFVEDQVKFYHTPGHTNDSSSCFDLVDQTLYVGDNVEHPIPYVSDPDVKTYIQSLETYLELAPKKIITGHGDYWSLDLVKDNIEYLKQIISGQKVDQSQWDEEIKKRHHENIKMWRNL